MLETKERTSMDALNEVGITYSNRSPYHEPSSARKTTNIKPLVITALVAIILGSAIMLAMYTESGLLSELIKASILVMTLTIIRQMDMYRELPKQ